MTSSNDREDQTQRALTDHKAADRVVDLASKSLDGFAVGALNSGSKHLGDGADNTPFRVCAPGATAS